jgi:hypothetical protein
MALVLLAGLLAAAGAAAGADELGFPRFSMVPAGSAEVAKGEGEREPP